jgi:hypothetical protein
MQPLLVAFSIVETVESARRSHSPINLENAASAIIARHPGSGATRGEVLEVLREEALAAGVIPPETLSQ